MPVRVYPGYTPTHPTISGPKCVQMKSFSPPLTLSRAVLRHGSDKISLPSFRHDIPEIRMFTAQYSAADPRSMAGYAQETIGSDGHRIG